MSNVSNITLILYHNTSNENALKINKEGIIPGLRSKVYGKGSEAEGSGIWCSTIRGYGYGGATITFKVNENDKDVVKQNDTEYVIYRKILPSEIIDIDLCVSTIPSNGTHNTVESDIPLAIKKYGKDKLLNVFNKNQNKFTPPYNYEQFIHLIETGEKYCKGTISLTENKVQGIPSKYDFLVKDMYKGGDGYWVIELEDGYDDGVGNNYIWEKTKKEALLVLDTRYNEYKSLKESKHKIEEVSRNDLLAKAKKQTITRYKKSAGYKGFSIVDIDTTSVFTTNCLRVTCRVGKYWDTVEMENILYWIQLAAEEKTPYNEKYQITTKGVTKAIMNSIDGMDIKIDCSCPDFCLEENTLIKLLNGEVISVKDMKDRFDNNEELWVYSTDEKGDFKPGKVTNVWISGYKDEMIKITLDNGREIITTPNHRYMMRDGSYKRADELKEKDSLMPLYFNYHNGYEAVKSNSEKVTTYHSVYKLVADELLQDKKEEARQRTGEDIIQIHHKDFNKLNNYPSNLNPMGRLEHWHYHASLGKEHIGKFIEAGREFWKSDPRRFKAAEKQKRKAREYQINMWSNFTPEEREEYINKSRQAINRDKLSSALKDVWSSYSLEDRNKRLETNSFITNNPMTNEEFRNSEAFVIRNNNISKSLKEFHKNTTAEQRSKLYGWSKGKKFSDEHRNRISESLKGKKHTEEYKENMSKKQKEIAPRLKQSRCFRNIRELIEQKKDITPENFLANRRGGDTHYLNVFDSFEDMVSTFYNTQQYNHKVAKVEVIHYGNAIPVYDIEVEKYHNFYVDAGVMLHNCYRFAYMATKLKYKYGKPENRPADITNPNDYGSMCKHLISMLSNKKWLQQVTGTVMDFIVDRIEDVNKYLKTKPGEELTLPNELARQNAKAAFYKKLFDKDEEVREQEDTDNNIEDTNVEQDKIDNTETQNNQTNNEQQEEGEE